MATPEPLKLRKVLSESNKIIKAQPRNFSALTFLFLTPPTIAALLYPTLQSLFKETNDQPANTPYKNLINLLALALYVFNIVFSICAIGSISYTAFHGFSGEVIELKSAIKSLSSSFFPLLGTTLLVQIIVFIIAFILSLLAISGSLLVSGGFRIDQLLSSPHFVGFAIALMVVMVLLVFYLQVSWSLAHVVVVVESAWGFKALKRSNALIKGNRGLALSLCLIFAIPYVYYMWIYMSPYLGPDLSGSTAYTSDEWKHLWLDWALRVFCYWYLLTIIQRFSLIATTVLYAYCKAIDDKKKSSGDHYVNLLVDHDDKDVAVV